MDSAPQTPPPGDAEAAQIKDPVERIVADALRRSGTPFIHESQDKTIGLDFLLPTLSVLIECKQFHAARVVNQLARHSQVILIQGLEAARAFATICDTGVARPVADDGLREAIERVLDAEGQRPVDYRRTAGVIASHAAVREADLRRQVEVLRGELTEAIGAVHYANGVADLAIKHRNEAEAERDGWRGFAERTIFRAKAELAALQPKLVIAALSPDTEQSRARGAVAQGEGERG